MAAPLMPQVQRVLSVVSRWPGALTLRPSWSVYASLRNNSVPSQRSSTTMWQPLSPRLIHTTVCVYKNRSGPSTTAKSPLQQQVQLLNQHGESMGQMTKKEAYKVADRQQLKLLEIEGMESGMPIFKLATSRERIDIQKQLREQRRAAGPKTEMKTLRLKSKISTHDLEIKVKHMKEFIQKGHSVRVIVQNNSSDSKVMSSIFKEVTSSVENVAVIKQAKDAAEQMEIRLTPLEQSEVEKPNEKLKPFTNEELKSQASGNKTAS